MFQVKGSFVIGASLVLFVISAFVLSFYLNPVGHGPGAKSEGSQFQEPTTQDHGSPLWAKIVSPKVSPGEGLHLFLGRTTEIEVEYGGGEKEPYETALYSEPDGKKVIFSGRKIKYTPVALTEPGERARLWIIVKDGLGLEDHFPIPLKVSRPPI